MNIIEVFVKFITDLSVITVNRLIQVPHNLQQEYKQSRKTQRHPAQR